jgi:hypothetical protein
VSNRLAALGGSAFAGAGTSGATAGLPEFPAGSFFVIWLPDFFLASALAALEASSISALARSQRVLQFDVAGDEMEQGLGKLFVEIFNRAGDTDRRRQSVVLTIGDLLRDDVHAKLVVFDVAHGEQDTTMPQERR